jgi:hypothetical protein
MSFAGREKNGCSTITPPFSPKGSSNNGRTIIPTLSAHMQINNTHGCNTAMVTHSLVTYPRALAYVRRMSTCAAVANIYACNLHVHTKLGVTKYELFKGIAYCTIHLAFYSASDWKHYRSTRKIISPPTSPGPAISDLHPADAGPLSRVGSGSANAGPQVNLHALIAKNLHPRCQQRTSPRTCSQAHRSGPFARESP